MKLFSGTLEGPHGSLVGQFVRHQEVHNVLTFMQDLAEEELQFAKVGTGAEVALRHIARKARESLEAMK